jgi:glutathione S-transferase
MTELYHNDMSVCAQKVRLVLAETGQPWVSHHLSLAHGENRTPAYLAINPTGMVPTLLDAGAIIPQSNVIASYLNEVAGHPLSPPTPLGRARMAAWTLQLDEDVHKSTGMLTFAVAFRHQNRPGMDSATLRARARAAPHLAAMLEPLADLVDHGPHAPALTAPLFRFEKLLTDMEAALQSTPYLAGDRVTLADLAFTPYITRLHHLQFDAWWQTRPALAAWFAAMQARPSYRTAITNWLNADYLTLMAAQGPQAWPLITARLTATP